MCTLQRQASPVVPKLPRSSQRIISWSGSTKQVLAGRWEWDKHCLGRQGQNAALPKDHGLQVWGLVGSPGRCQGTVAAILTGGPALPAWLDGVALISRGTTGGENRLSVAFSYRPLSEYDLLPSASTNLHYLSQRRPVYPGAHASHVAWPSVSRKQVSENLWGSSG